MSRCETWAPEQLDDSQVNRLLLGGVVPRPIAWVSTSDLDGVVNLAPFSYFTVASTDPPMLCITIEPHDDGSAKDTLRNVRSTRQLVVNVVPEELADEMWSTSLEAESQVDELVDAGLTPSPSNRVAPPRVSGTPLAMECEVEKLLPTGNAVIVIARIVTFIVQTDVLEDSGRVRPEALRAVGRIGGRFVRTVESFPLPQRPTERDARS